MPLRIWVPKCKSSWLDSHVGGNQAEETQSNENDEIDQSNLRTQLFYDEKATVLIQLTHAKKPSSVWLETTLSGVIGPQRVPIICNLGTIRLGDADIVSQTEGSIVWHTQVDISHPRSKSINPQIHFQAGIVMSAESTPTPSDVLQDFAIVKQWNMFDSFDKLDLGGRHNDHFHHSASTTTTTTDLSLPVASALSLRLSSANLGEGTLVATMEVSTSDCPVTIHSIDLTYPEGQINPMGAADNLSLPFQLDEHEVCTKVFKLRLPSSTSSSKPIYSSPNSQSQLSAPVMLSVRASPKDETEILMKWDTSVNFELSNPSQTYTRAPLLHRSTSTASLRQKPFSGLLLTCAGPSVVKTGSKFVWEVLAINRAAMPRQLCFSFTTPHTEVTNPGILSTIRELRSGPIAPQACFRIELNLLAIRSGLFALPNLCISDLTNGAVQDGISLPTVYVET